MFPKNKDAHKNRLLALLPAASLSRLVPKLMTVDLSLGQVMCKPEATIEAVYFPLDGMISLVTALDEGTQAEVGLVGCEGFFGLPLILGVETSFVEAVVQLPGMALTMEAAVFRREVAENIPLRMLLLRYGEAFQAQIMQTAACNGRHGLKQRLARWLLMARDRTGADKLTLTQDFMATMLGVHRPTVTVTAGTLQKAGLITYANGVITILDRASLEASSCECYQAVRSRFDRIFGPIDS